MAINDTNHRITPLIHPIVEPFRRFSVYLANQGYDLRLIQDYLGHRDPKHTVHYTRVAGSRFEGLWR